MLDLPMKKSSSTRLRVSGTVITSTDESLDQRLSSLREEAAMRSSRTDFRSIQPAEVMFNFDKLSLSTWRRKEIAEMSQWKLVS